MSYSKVITEEDIYKIVLDISTKGFDNVVKQAYISFEIALAKLIRREPKDEL